MAAPTQPVNDVVSQIGRLFSWPAVALAASDWQSGLKSHLWSDYVVSNVMPVGISFAPTPPPAAAAPATTPALPPVSYPAINPIPGFSGSQIAVPATYQGPQTPAIIAGQVF